MLENEVVSNRKWTSVHADLAGGLCFAGRNGSAKLEGQKEGCRLSSSKKRGAR